MKVSTEGLSSAAVLAALYNAARPLGLGFLQYDPVPMSEEEAQKVLDDGSYIDYLWGRPLKTKFDDSGVIDTGLYDRDQGEGAGEAAIKALRESGDPRNDAVVKMHTDGIGDAVEKVRSQLPTPSTIDERGGMTVVTLGMDDMAEHVEAALKDKDL